MPFGKKIIMGITSDRKRIVEHILKTEYEKKGFLSEDDIIDICIDHDLDLVLLRWLR